MDNSKEKVTFIELLKIIIKRVRISTLILLLITFASTTFAWFVYATRIQAGITAHIEAWNIVFTANDTNIAEYVTFQIPNLYPGMDNYSDSISAYNMGEKSATVRFEIMSVRILNVNYVVDETTLTSDQMINSLARDFPFTISLALTNQEVDANSGTTTFSIDVSWPYESGHDELDTDWGLRAYTFAGNNPSGTPSIEMVVKITAVQSNS